MEYKGKESINSVQKNAKDSGFCLFLLTFDDDDETCDMVTSISVLETEAFCVQINRTKCQRFAPFLPFSASTSECLILVDAVLVLLDVTKFE